jgi:hypothetical protein
MAKQMKTTKRDVRNVPEQLRGDTQRRAKRQRAIAKARGEK